MALRAWERGRRGRAALHSGAARITGIPAGDSPPVGWIPRRHGSLGSAFPKSGGDSSRVPEWPACARRGFADREVLVGEMRYVGSAKAPSNSNSRAWHGTSSAWSRSARHEHQRPSALERLRRTVGGLLLQLVRPVPPHLRPAPFANFRRLAFMPAHHAQTTLFTEVSNCGALAIFGGWFT